MQQVHLRINDASTGQPTPVRLRITDTAGTYYAPYGRLTEFATGVNQDVGGNVMIGAKKWCYIDGTCEILLPPGQLHIEITKGFEYKPIDEEITLLAGKMSLRFTIERWCDMRKEGWYSGDTRVHFMSPDAALLEGQAEDVAVVNLLAVDTAIEEQLCRPVRLAPEVWATIRELMQKAIDGKISDVQRNALNLSLDAAATIDRANEALVRNTQNRNISNIISFSGQSYVRQSPSCGVAVNTLNRNIYMGSLGLLHCHRVVHPLASGNPSDSEWTLRDWCGQCHRKNGLVIWTNSLGLVDPSPYGEALADLILGEIDAFEMQHPSVFPHTDLEQYYALCNAEFVTPLVAGSAKQDNQSVLGVMRTYAYLHGQPLTYTGWIEAVRAGRTFVSNGPLLEFTIDGKVPMSEVMVSTNAPVQVRASARSWSAFEKLELLWNGEVFAEASVDSCAPFHAVLNHALTVERDGYLMVRCRGEESLAHSSAVAIRRPEGPGWATATAVHYLMNELDAMLAWAKEKTLPRLCHVLEEARTALGKKLS